MRKFWDDNKVLILGLIASTLMLLQQLTKGVENVDWKAVIVAVGLAGAGYVGKNWRGQTNSIIGIIGQAGYSIQDVYYSGHFTWLQVVIQLGILYLTTSVPDPKSRGYELTDTIKNAKVEGEIAKPTVLTSVAVKQEVADIKAQSGS